MNNKTYKCVVAVPARLESKRLPKKVLMDIGGKSMIQRVLEQCSKAKSIEKVILCTDSEELKKTADEFAKNRNIKILTLPTGQGFILKP